MARDAHENPDTPDSASRHNWQFYRLLCSQKSGGTTWSEKQATDWELELEPISSSASSASSASLARNKRPSGKTPRCHDASGRWNSRQIHFRSAWGHEVSGRQWVCWPENARGLSAESHRMHKAGSRPRDTDACTAVVPVDAPQQRAADVSPRSCEASAGCCRSCQARCLCDRRCSVTAQLARKLRALQWLWLSLLGLALSTMGLARGQPRGRH